ncbi:MAG: hypothetical protein O4808_04185 [Trichodesmium sp. St17_bin3_1_1]|nr:hypothetical protein [Trichodesmium sp. St18_bin1]MDE5106292.1 hypothetical protein [Trichodesmium sp. St17_bin3_1_1]
MTETIHLKRHIKRKKLEELEEYAVTVGNYNLRHFVWHAKDMFFLRDISELLLIKYQQLKFIVYSEANLVERQMITVNYKGNEEIGISSYLFICCAINFVSSGSKENYIKLFKEIYRICKS